MKKLFLIIVVLCMAFSTQASDYSYLVIHEINGGDTYMAANGARFSVSDGNLIVTHSEGIFSSKISDISYMAFTNEPAGVESVFSEMEVETELYSAQGLFIGHYKSAKAALEAIHTSGVYVFKNRKGTVKIQITK